MLFRDRADAGAQLARKLRTYTFVDPIIMALPRGGVPVAKKISEELQIPLDVLVVRKIGVPGHKELGVGAVTEEGLMMFNDELMKRLQLTPEMLELVIDRETEELERRVKRYRSGRPLPSIRNRDVILVDDGLATGYTAAVAVQYLHGKGAREVTLAVPVCGLDSECLLEHYADHVLCLKRREPLFSVGFWYENFEQTTDREVIDLLNGFEQDGHSSPPGVL
jgi:putative phosphoribosyl transferase